MWKLHHEIIKELEYFKLPPNEQKEANLLNILCRTYNCTNDFKKTITFATEKKQKVKLTYILTKSHSNVLNKFEYRKITKKKLQKNSSLIFFMKL